MRVLFSYSSIGLLAISLSLIACGGGGSGGYSGPGKSTPPTPAAPVAQDDLAGTGVDQPIDLDVLANDGAADGGTIVLSSFDAASSEGGTVERLDQGTPETDDDLLRYTPPTGFSGTDTFNYSISNADGVSDTATVTVEVNNTQPDANDDFALTQLETPVDIDVLANDSDPNGGSIDLASFDASSAQGGTVERLDNGTPADLTDDTLRYTPPDSYAGADQFSYGIQNDAGGVDTAIVGISIQAPEATGDCHQDVANKHLIGQKYCVEASITSHDGTEIAFSLFVPDRAAMFQNAVDSGVVLNPADKGFAPLVVHSHGFGGNKQEQFDAPGATIDNQITLDAWNAGYWVISYTQRGFGELGLGQDAERPSGGRIGLMSPGLEGMDFVSLVNWANCHLRDGFDPANFGFNMDPEADNCGASLGDSLLRTDDDQRANNLTDDLSLATIGYSYGGGFQFVAQSVDPRIDAMIPMGTWHDLRYSLHPNDTPKTAWTTIMTAFAVQGGNGQPLPTIIVEGNTQMNGVNLDLNDFPQNKARQVSVKNANLLAANGAAGFCDGNPEYYASNFNDENGDDNPPIDAGKGPDPFLDWPDPLPTNATNDRAARADLLMIQGYGDTLFNFNEGYDNARCFEESGRDVVFIAQTSGHPLPAVGPSHYAGFDTGMYLDEVIHCGTDGSSGEPVRYNTRELGMQWIDDKLRGVGNFDTAFPHKVCITQQNTYPDAVLDAADPFFSGSNSASNAYQFSREGWVADDVADITVGGNDATDEFDVPATSVRTGPSPSIQGQGQPPAFAPLYTVPEGESRVLAGIPLVQLDVSRVNLLLDELLYVGVGVQRCRVNPETGDSCESDAPFELLHFQVSPVRVFPALLALGAGLPPSTVGFPKEDPRNDPNGDGDRSDGSFYPIFWGDNPNERLANSGALTKARLAGVTARLQPGDQVGLAFYAEHGTYTSMSSGAIGQVTVTGKAWLPLQEATPAPSKAGQDYILER